MYTHDQVLFCCDVTGQAKKQKDKIRAKKAQAVSHIPRSIVPLDESEMQLVIIGIRTMIDAYMTGVRAKAGDSRITYTVFHTSNV